MVAGTRTSPENRLLFEMLTGGTDPAVTREALQHLQSVRQHSPETGLELDQLFVREITRLRGGLAQAQENHHQLEQLLRKLTRPPLHPALFMGWATAGDWGQVAIVSHNGARLLVPTADGVPPDSLRLGDEVLLGGERNVLVGKSPCPALRCGETALFDRFTDGRAVLRWRDEELVVDLSENLRGLALRNGDRVRWDRGSFVAFEKVEAPTGQHLFLEERPTETFDDIGGLDEQIEELQRSIHLHLLHPETARRYRLAPKRSVLLVGGPGTGKTMMARALAHWLGTLPGVERTYFMHIRPSALHSVWYSESERNYREVFRIARERGAQDPRVPVVMFFDEVDAIAASRGEALMRVDDRVLTAFMAELDGLEPRGNVLVVAATNRLDALDPAVVRPGRLGDLTIRVPRPNMKAARAIFARHLASDIPCAGDGPDPAAAREELMDAAVSRLYAPNAGSDLATIIFRDGRQQAIRAADLVSGAIIAKIARCTIERACRREVETGDGGVRLEDVLLSIDDELDGMCLALTPANCRRYLTELPQDVDVVRVDRRRRRGGRAHRYLNLPAGADA